MAGSRRGMTISPAALAKRAPRSKGKSETSGRWIWRPAATSVWRYRFKLDKWYIGLTDTRDRAKAEQIARAQRAKVVAIAQKIAKLETRITDLKRQALR